MYRWFVSLFRPKPVERRSDPSSAPPVSVEPSTPVVQPPLPPPVKTEIPKVSSTPIPVGKDAIHTLWTYVTRPMRFARKVDPGFIAKTLEALDPAFVVDLDGKMRETGPFASTWHDAKAIEDLDVLGLPKPTLNVLAAMHPSGWIREHGLRGIAKAAHDERSRHALGCTLLRLNDWVDNVRDIARDSIDDMLAHACIEDWALAFPSLLRLRGAKRHAHEDLYLEATARLAREPRSNAMRHHIESAPPHVAMQALTIRLSPQAEDRDQLLHTALHRSEARVRRYLIEALTSSLTLKERDHVLDALETDPCESNRLVALGYRTAHASDDAAIRSLSRLLIDASPRIRGYCQRELLDRSDNDLATLYRDAAIKADSARTLAAALDGLREVGTGSDASFILEHVRDPRSRVRASAITGIGALKPLDSSHVFLEALSDESGRVSHTALDVIREHPHMVSASHLRRLVRTSPVAHVRKHALEALLAKGNWAPLASLIEFAATHHEPRSKAWVESRFQSWRTAHDSWTEAPKREVETDFTKAFETYAAKLDPTMRSEVSFLLDALDSRRYIE